MKSPTICPNCGSSFSVLRVNEGKRAKCPKCGQPFVITFPDESPAEFDFSKLNASQPPPITAEPDELPAFPPIVTPQAADTPKRFARKKITLPMWAVVASPALATLVLGYFVGREHLKYQIRSAFSDVGAAFADGLGDTSRSATLGRAKTIAQLPVEKTYNGDGFSITVKRAQVENPELEYINMGGEFTGATPEFVVALDFFNSDDRKFVTYQKANSRLTTPFGLRDDVGNVIREIDYGSRIHPADALTSSQDILPGESISHVLVFSVPPPKTQYLVLSVNTACLGGDGVVEFKIPAAAISQ